MSVNPLIQAGLQSSGGWQPGPIGAATIPVPAIGGPALGAKEDLKARNRIAAKKWRDKKDEMLTDLEAANDALRKEALLLRKEVLSLQTENQVLEEELRFFQSFMTKIMNVAPKHGQRGEQTNNA